MATLTGQQIDASYLGLLKTTDNGTIGVTAKALTDGGGNATNIQVSNTATNFPSGTVDFTGSTVSGLNIPIRAGSLTTDNFPNNFRNIATTGGTPASSTAYGWESMSFGHQCNTVSARAIAIGIRSLAGDNSQGIGGAISIGWDISNTGHRSVAIGSTVVNKILASADDQVNIGMTLTSSSPYGILIGNNSTNTATTGGISIGKDNTVNAAGAVALGTSVTAARVDTVSVRKLAIEDISGGIIMKSPNGTEFTLTVSDGGALVIT